MNNLYGWAISQKLLVGGFECIEETSQFNDDFIERYNKYKEDGYFLEADVQYP